MRSLALLCLLALAARAQEIVVRVTDGEKPVAGAGVAVITWGEFVFDRVSFKPDALTDKAGLAVVKISDGESVVVYRPGFALASLEPDVRLVDVALKPERIFSGRVTDTSHEPVAGATVTLVTTAKQVASLRTTTDKEGRFLIYGLWLDNYKLSVEAQGFLPAGFSATEEDSGRSIELWRPAVIAGHVLEAEDTPAGGVPLRLRRGHDYVDTKSAADGTFRFPNLRAGHFKLEVWSPFSAKDTWIRLSDGEERADLEIPVLGPAQVRLRAVNAEKQPIAGAWLGWDGTPVASADAAGRISLPVTPGEGRLLKLNADGHVSREVRVVPTGPRGERDLGDVTLEVQQPITVEVRGPDGKPVALGKVGNHAVKDGTALVPEPGAYLVAVPGLPPKHIDVKNPGPVSVMLPEPHWLTGVVRDPEGKPVPGANVIVDSLTFQTNAQGRFRAGPLARTSVSASAVKGGLRSAMHVFVLSEGELDLVLMRKPVQRLIRGRILRGGEPVHRFTVEDSRFLTETGEFEALVSEAADWLNVEVDGRSYPVGVPPAGELLTIRLPEGALTLALEGNAKDTDVNLNRAGGLSVASSRPGDDGTVRFDGLAPGTYEVRALGFAPLRVRVAGGETTAVLRRTPTGTLRVRRGGVEKILRLNPGTHRDVHSGDDVTVLAATIAEGEELLLDLSPDDGVWVHVHGEPDRLVELVHRTSNAMYRFWGRIPQSGVLRLARVPPGTYSLGTREIELPRGVISEIALEPRNQSFGGLVKLANGRPAQGANVALVGDDGAVDDTSTDLQGAFRFLLSPGEYTCVAKLEGYADGVGSLNVTAAGVEASGFPIQLEEWVGVPLRIAGPAGDPLALLSLRVDGRWVTTTPLGVLMLGRVPARIDLDLEGYASIRDLVVTRAGEIRLQRGAGLVVLSDPGAGRVEVRIAGREWQGPLRRALARPGQGRLFLDDLPPGPVEVVLIPPEPEEGQEEQPPEAEIVRTRLISGEQVTVDLRAG